MFTRNQFAKEVAALKLILRMGLSLFAVIAAALLFFRVTGFEPWYIDPASAEFAESNRTAWPGLWLKGEVVDGPVTDWDFINRGQSSDNGKLDNAGNKNLVWNSPFGNC